MKNKGTHQLAAHVFPMAAFMLILMVPGFVKVKNYALPWWQHTPELWAYPLQILVCGFLLLRYRGEYRFGPCHARTLTLGALLGVIGIGLWILPAHGFRLWGWGAGEAPEFSIPLIQSEPMSLYGWLGMTERTDGFNPEFLQENPAAWWAAVVMRFVRMAVIVPFVEEIFWRGFLMRYFVNEDRPFWKNAFGTHKWKIYAIVTALVVLAHAPQDWLGAFVWGTLVYWLAVKTKSLGACVVMHAVANFLLGVYVMRTGQWGFW